MTVPANVQDEYQQFVANGAGTPQSITVRFLDADHLTVTANDAPQVLGVHYSVSGDGMAGTATITPLAPHWLSGVVIKMWRDTPDAQEYDIGPGLPLRAAALEQEFDRHALILGELRARSVSVLPGVDPIVMPSLVGQAGKVWGVNADEDLAFLNMGGADGAMRTDLAGGGGSALVGYQRSGAGAIARSVQTELRDLSIKPDQFRQPGDPDDTLSIERAVIVAFATGRPIEFLARTYVTDPIDIKSLSWITQIAGFSVFAAGLIMYGAGPGRTFISNNGGGPTFFFDSDFDHATDFRALYRVRIADMTLQPVAGATGASGLHIGVVYNYEVINVMCIGFDLDGAKIICVHGDKDGSVRGYWRQCKFLNNKRWGLDAKAGPNMNEISYLQLDQCWWQNNGEPQTFQATPSPANEPTGGGFRWKGQMLVMNQPAFTLNRGAACFITGGSGLGNGVTIDQMTLENNYDRALLITGGENMKISTLQIYANNSYQLRRGVEFYEVDYPIDCQIDGVYVRATSANNAIVMFKHVKAASAALSRVRVRNVTMNNFGYAGQVLFEGIEFDAIPHECVLEFTGALVKLMPGPNGSATPYRTRYGGVPGNHSESGEWVQYNVQPAGLQMDATGLANGTYHVYLYDDSRQPKISISSEAPIADVDTRYLVKLSEPGKVWVGRCSVAGGVLVTGAAANWCNPTKVAGGYTWLNGSGALWMKAGTVLPSSDTDGVAV